MPSGRVYKSATFCLVSFFDDISTPVLPILPFFFVLKLPCSHPCFSLNVFFLFFSHLFLPFLSFLFPLSFNFFLFLFSLGRCFGPRFLTPPVLALWDHASSFCTNQTHFMVTDKEKKKQTGRQKDEIVRHLNHKWSVKIISQRVGGCHRVRTLFSLVKQRPTSVRQQGGKEASSI